MRVPGSLTSDYDYALPPAQIAQCPLAQRDASRLMIVDRARATLTHATFRDLGSLIPAGDALVLNRTRVFRARLLGRRASGAPAEILLLKPLADGAAVATGDGGDGRFEAMVSPGGKLRPGRRIEIAPGFHVEILAVTERRTRIVRLDSDMPIDDAIARYGHVPLPPYIERADDAADAERYQTVYAREGGSVAAPTAGLHFTADLLHTLEHRGVRRGEVVLHVGAGTFKPVEVDDPSLHTMHEERYTVPADAARTIDDVRRAGGSVWAVGTTTVRTLETVATEVGTIRPESGDTRIFIRPPYRFRVVDRLITNFHLPRSTLLMLVAAFAGYDLTMRAYREAVAAGYRFYSYGDAMVVV